MGKYLNAFVEKAAESDSTVVKLTIIDFLHPKGSYEKLIVKNKIRQPHESVVTEVRKVTYLYNKKTTVGWEIVKEIMVPRGTGSDMVPTVVDEVVRDLRKEEKPKFKKYQDEEENDNTNFNR